MARPRILISEPNESGAHFAFLPYVWAILKSYWEHHGSNRDAFEWLDPIFSRDSIADDLNKYASTPPDVLGLSCYNWNWDLQCQIARWAKQQNPACLVIAGGPDPDYKDREFFSKQPFIDAIVVKDGEIPFTAILEAVLAGSRDFRQIPGLYLPRTLSSIRMLDDSPHLFTGPAQVPAVFDHSPYLEQAELYDRIVAARGRGAMNATWETNRGCPYGCSFCDWGSATLSKVRKFDLARVDAEADWLGKMGINFLFLADANFGILARDIEIADRLSDAKARHGYPQYLYYSSAKNNPERTVEIARRTHAARLNSTHVLSVQHTDSAVLAATERSNIPAEKYREVVASLIALDIPSEVQLIAGIPGDTPAKWRECLGEIMDWGVHDGYSIFTYALLPNAPAADPRFVAEWKTETIDRWFPDLTVKRERAATDELPKSRIVVACRSYSREDWVGMMTYAAFVKGYHNRALTRFPAMYLRFAHDISYREIYETIIEGFCRENSAVAAIYRQVQEHYQHLLRDPSASDQMQFDDLPANMFFADPARWLFVKTCLQLDEFYEEMTTFLAARFPQARALRSAIEYQKNLVVLPDYQAGEARSFSSAHDWPAFFAQAQKLTRYQHLDEPDEWPAARRVRVAPDETRGRRPLDFGGGSREDRWRRWIDQVVVFENTLRFTNFLPLG